MKSEHPVSEVKNKLEQLFDELLAHEGYGDLRLEIRILKRGQKEIILHCGKQHRYVVNSTPTMNNQNIFNEQK
ncbi:MAG: hypothetical protein ABL925_08540 [Methylococcales bacterium]